MKIQARSVDSFLRRIDAKISVILLYGPDGGLVRERADRLAVSIAGDAGDPFRVSEITAARLRDEPTLLADEAAALTFGGGRRVVRLRDAGEAATGAVQTLLEAPGGGLIVLEAGDLAPQSNLRRLAESAGNAAALPCYRDETEDLGRLVDEEVRRAGLRLASDAFDYLIANLGGDRGVTRRELEKLICFVGNPSAHGEVELSDVIACIGDSAALSLDDLVLAAADGHASALERAMTRCLDEGIVAVRILGAAGRHFLRLHRISGAAGSDRERVIATLRPPVFFRHKPRLLQQAQQWSPLLLARAIDRLTQAELACKSPNMKADVAETLCRRALLEIAVTHRSRSAA
ncbi:MAG: DNA polymerase III subunit delta [Dongiaceae bacterium]